MIRAGFVGEGAGRDVNTFGPVFYLARTDTRCWTAGLGGNTLRGCAELRAVVARCRARSPVQFRAAPVASALPPQRRALFPPRSRRAFRSRRCPADHWPVAQDRPRSMLLAVLLALNPFSRYSNRYAPITRVGKPNHSACRGSAGSKHWQASSAQVQPESIISRVPVQRADTDYRIADPVDRRFAGRHEVVPPCGLNTPSLYRWQTYTRHKATSSTP